MSESMHRKRIGDYLVEKGLIEFDSVAMILKLCEEKKIKFGEASIELGLITEEDLKNALSYPYKKELLIRLNADYFPKETLHFFNSDEILSWGILPLGVKRKTGFFKSKKILNLVCIGSEPKDEIRKEILERATKNECAGIQFFHALPHEFLKVAEIHYAFNPSAYLSSVTQNNLDSRLHPSLRRLLKD